MQQDFWSARWSEGRIGFHRSEPTESLVELAGRVLPAPPARILVPMCGKTTDMLWLAEQGYEVVGVEFVRQACEDFFSDNGLSFELTREGDFEVFRCAEASIELRCGDAFALEPELLSQVDGVHDRAGLVALDPATRDAYVATMAAGLRPGTPYLLIALERTIDPEKGPPFSLPEATLRSLLEPTFTLEQLRDPARKAPDDRGMVEGVYMLRRT